jgi:hypothetical protein
MIALQPPYSARNPDRKGGDTGVLGYDSGSFSTERTLHLHAVTLFRYIGVHLRLSAAISPAPPSYHGQYVTVASEVSFEEAPV